MFLFGETRTGQRAMHEERGGGIGRNLLTNVEDKGRPTNRKPPTHASQNLRKGTTNDSQAKSLPPFQYPVKISRVPRRYPLSFKIERVLPSDNHNNNLTKLLFSLMIVANKTCSKSPGCGNFPMIGAQLITAETP